jgi:hypothetical protein
VSDEKKPIEYCCIWCHEPLSREKAYVNHRGSILCGGCRGLGAVLNKWNKPCKRQHFALAPQEAMQEVEADAGRRED